MIFFLIGGWAAQKQRGKAAWPASTCVEIFSKIVDDDCVFNEAKGVYCPRRPNPGVQISGGYGDAIPDVDHVVFAAHVKDFMCKTFVKI